MAVNRHRPEVASPSTGEAVHDFFSSDEIFQRVAATADEETSRPTRLMFLSGLAAGLSIGLSFYARAAITAQVPETPLVGNLLYPIGFLLIVIGRYQLFTENTLTPVTLVLTRIASVPTLLRVWGTVLAANLVGAFILAFALANTGILSDEAAATALDFWEHAIATSWDSLFFKGVMAGWLVASMVWLVHAARDTVSRILLVFFMMFLIPSADLYHCIIGFCEAAYGMFVGAATVNQAVFEFFLPVLLGNTVGGVLLVAILNFAMTRDLRFPDRDCSELQLTWREWLFGFYTGEPTRGDDRPIPLRTSVQDSDHMRGVADAPVTLVQYGDFACPTSREIYESIADLDYHTEVPVRYVWRHLPLSRLHPQAVDAALAAEAAAEQGKFWQMFDKLFANQSYLTRDDLFNYAQDLNLDIEQFKARMVSRDLRDKIENSRENAVYNGVRSTNNLFVNGERYHDVERVRELARLVERSASTVEADT